MQKQAEFENRARRFLNLAGAVLTGDHFVYTQGGHGSAYINKDALYVYPLYVSDMCRDIATAFRDHKEIDAVVAPEKGGIALVQWVAFHLFDYNITAAAVYAEKKSKEAGGGFYFGRGYDKYVRGQQVLVVEDILNTGGSVKEVIKAVQELEGEVIGVAAICNRGGVTAEQLGVKQLLSLVELKLEIYSEDDCPFCRVGIPINTEVGKGKEYLARKQAG
jgi:orotate phosphoribosyltransferase